MVNENVDITRNYHGDNPESVAAHDSIRPSKAKQRALVLKLIREAGALGMTSDEAEQALGLRHQACSARFTELKAEDAIVEAGRRRTRSGRMAQAWRVA